MGEFAAAGQRLDWKNSLAILSRMAWAHVRALGTESEILQR